jgi:hypothetical protein
MRKRSNGSSAERLKVAAFFQQQFRTLIREDEQSKPAKNY